MEKKNKAVLLTVEHEGEEGGERVHDFLSFFPCVCTASNRKERRRRKREEEKKRQGVVSDTGE